MKVYIVVCYFSLIIFSTVELTSFATYVFVMFSSSRLLTLNCQSQHLSSALSSACDFNSHFLQTVWTQIRLGAVEEQSDQGPHCLPVCKNRFEKFPRIYKQTTLTDDSCRCRFSWRFKGYNIQYCHV